MQKTLQNYWNSQARMMSILSKLSGRIVTKGQAMVERDPVLVQDEKSGQGIKCATSIIVGFNIFLTLQIIIYN